MKLRSIVCAAFVIMLSLFGAARSEAQVNVHIGPARHHHGYYHRRPVVRERVIVRERPIVRERVIVRERPAYRHHRHYRRY